MSDIIYTIREKWNAGFNDREPIYQQITNLFCRSLVKGEIQSGQRIPSIRDMAMTLKVNANTIQRVYQEMERQGVIYSRRGTGYFVTEDTNMIEDIQANMARESMKRFLEEMRGLGFSDEQIITGLSRNMKGDEEHDIIASDK